MMLDSKNLTTFLEHGLMGGNENTPDDVFQ